MNSTPTTVSTAKTVLIVDDDVDIRDVLSMFLEEEGYTVATAPNGRAALIYLREHPDVSVILLDLMMPIMTGFQFREAQKLDPLIATIPVVIMTARGALEPGAIDACDILPKPLPFEMLIESLNRARRHSPLANA